MKSSARIDGPDQTDDVGGSLVPGPSHVFQHSQGKLVQGTRLFSEGGDATVYEDVDKGIRTAALEMKENSNEAYGLVT